MRTDAELTGLEARDMGKKQSVCELGTGGKDGNSYSGPASGRSDSTGGKEHGAG